MRVECAWGSDIVTAAALHLGATVSPDRLLNFCDFSGSVSPRLDPAAPAREAGFVASPDGSGLGVAPDRDILGEPVAVID